MITLICWGPLVPNVTDPGLSLDVIAFHKPIHHTHLRIVSHEDRPVLPSTKCCTSPVPSQGTRIFTYPPMISRHSFSSQVAKGAERTNKKNQSSLPSEFFHSEHAVHLWSRYFFGPPVLMLPMRTHHLSLTFPHHQDLQGRRACRSHLPKRQPLEIFKSSPSLVLCTALVTPSAMSGKRDPGGWYTVCLRWPGRCQRLMNRHRPRSPMSITLCIDRSTCPWNHEPCV